MNQKVTTEIKDTICSSCFCGNQKFLHHVWDGHKSQKICTSCVLFSNRLYFCPTCFYVPSEQSELVVICNRCRSLTHAKCLAANEKPAGAPFVCSTCKDPSRLVFTLKKFEVEGDNGRYEGIDKNAAKLLLTAAKIVCKSLVKVTDDADYDAMIDVTKAVSAKKTAKWAVEQTMNLEKSNHGPSLIDSVTDNEEDSSLETLRETKKLHRLLIGNATSEGQNGRVAMEIDLNKN
uniref:uncharacterized protein LOC122593925 n=1 Tax=Erigeron canadensis TaxID=72917 RepID=UPI001CB8EFAF|nr:uncharacterized protein LOC122593925 [Erigeron canadensis]